MFNKILCIGLISVAFLDLRIQVAGEPIPPGSVSNNEKTSKGVKPNVVSAFPAPDIEGSLVDAIHWTADAIDNAENWLVHAAKDTVNAVDTAVEDGGRWLHVAVNDTEEWVHLKTNVPNQWLHIITDETGKMAYVATNHTGEWVKVAAKDIYEALSHAGSDAAEFMDKHPWIAPAATGVATVTISLG